MDLPSNPVELVLAIIAAISAGIAAFKSHQTDRSTRNGNEKTLVSMVEELGQDVKRVDIKTDDVLAWQGQHDALHRRDEAKRAQLGEGVGNDESTFRPAVSSRLTAPQPNVQGLEDY